MRTPCLESRAKDCDPRKRYIPKQNPHQPIGCGGFALRLMTGVVVHNLFLLRHDLLLTAEARTVAPAVLWHGHSLVGEEPPEPDDAAASDDMTGADGAVTFVHGASRWLR